MLSNSKIKFSVVLAVVILIIGQLGWATHIKNFVVWAGSPVTAGVRSTSASAHIFFNNLLAIRTLAREVSELKTKLVTLETENAELRSSLLEYEELSRAFDLKSRGGYSLISGRVVGADPVTLSQTLLIDRGSQNGVVEDQAVLDASGAYIGRIARVFKNTSELTLISDVKSRLPVEVVESRARGIVQGQYALNVSLVEVPSGQNLPKGGRLVTTGFTSGVPQGLIVGYIDKVVSKSGDIFQQATVRAASDLKNLRLVFVVAGF